MKNKSLQSILYSTAGLAAVAVILIGLNALGSAFKVRLDLTQEKAYTLSDGTRAILNQLDGPVRLRFYCTQSEQSSPETVFLKSYARKVEDLLAEFRQAGRGNILIEKFNPLPDSDAEDQARFDGIQPEQLPNGELFYLGLAVTRLDEKQVVPLPPNRERLMEYDIVRAIARVINPTKPVIGLMTTLPVWGQPMNPMMMQMGQRGSDPWILLNELRADFDVRRIEPTADAIPDEVKVLLVLHPKDISDATQFALDQFVLRGGKLIAFLDAYSVVDSRSSNPMMGGLSMGSSSNLEKLLRAWGLTFDSTKVVADVNLLMELGGRGNQPVRQPTWLSLTRAQMDKDDVITSEIDNLWVPMAGAFSGTPAPGLTQTILLRSTRDSQLVEGFMASMSPESVLRDFKSADKEHTLALRLAGKFKTAFPDGKPGVTDTNAAPATLKESAVESAVILVGDADLLYDNFAVRVLDSPFGRLAMPMNANLNFAQNAVEQMAGDQNLIRVRSRATLNRPFEVVRQKQAEANARFQAEVAKLQEKLNATQERLRELQAQKTDGSQRFILSPEQEQELLKFQQQEAETRRELKRVQKELNREIDRLKRTLTWLNILGMPLLVAVFGVGLAIVKARKTGAK
jgi:ABC-type uncharacterized transport system involved in gliding motility auxiliary subunit